MGLSEMFTSKMSEFGESPKIKNLKGTALLKLFGLTKVPLIFMVNPSVKELSPKRCAVLVPLNMVTKNHWGTMYFGALAIGADCSAGLFAMYKADQIKGTKFSIVFKDFKASFLKRPESDVLFVCNDAEAIDKMLEECRITGERVTRQIKIEARIPSNNDELVAEFELGLSLKRQQKK